MNQNVEFIRKENLFSVIYPSFIQLDHEFLKLVESQEKDEQVEELIFLLVQSNIRNRDNLLRLFDLINKFPKTKKFQLSIGYENRVSLTSFMLLIKNISNLSCLERLELQFDDNVLDFDEFEQKNSTLDSKMYQIKKIPLLKNLQVVINKIVLANNSNTAINSIIGLSKNLINLNLKIRDNQINHKQIERMCFDFNQLTQLEQVQFSISNNNELIMYQPLLQTFSSMRLAFFSLELENQTFCNSSREPIQNIKNNTLNQVRYNFIELKNLDNLLQDSLENLKNFRELKSFQMKVNNCEDIEVLDIEELKNIYQTKRDSSIDINIEKTNISENAFANLLRLLATLFDNLQKIHLLLNEGEIKIEFIDDKHNQVKLYYQNFKSKNVQNLIQQLNVFFQHIGRIDFVELAIMGQTQYGFKFNDNLIRILVVKMLNCEQNLLSSQHFLTSFNRKDLQDLVIQFLYTKKLYEQETKQLENALVNFKEIQSLSLHLEKVPSLSSDFFIYLSDQIKKKIRKIDVAFVFDEKLYEDEKIVENMLKLTESLSEVTKLEIKCDAGLKCMRIKAEQINKQPIQLKIFFKEFSFFILICIFKGFRNIKIVSYFELIISEQIKEVKFIFDSLFIKNIDSSYKVCKKIDRRFPFLFYLLESFFPNIDFVESLSVHSAEWASLQEILSPKNKIPLNEINLSTTNSIKIKKLNIYSYYDLDAQSFFVNLMNQINPSYLKDLSLQFVNQDRQIINSQNDTMQLQKALSKLYCCNKIDLQLSKIPCFTEDFILQFENLMMMQTLCSVSVQFNLDNLSEDKLIRNLQKLCKNKQIKLSIHLNGNNPTLIKTAVHHFTYNFFDIYCRNKVTRTLLSLLKGTFKLNKTELKVFSQYFNFQVNLDENQISNYLQNENSNQKEQQFLQTNNEYTLLNIVLQQIQKLEFLELSDSFSFNLLDFSKPFIAYKLNIKLNTYKNEILNLSNFKNLKILKIDDHRFSINIQNVGNLLSQVLNFAQLLSFDYINSKYEHDNFGQYIQINNNQPNQLRVLKIIKNKAFNCNTFRKFKRLVVLF